MLAMTANDKYMRTLKVGLKVKHVRIYKLKIKMEEANNLAGSFK